MKNLKKLDGGGGGVGEVLPWHPPLDPPLTMLPKLAIYFSL